MAQNYFSKIPSEIIRSALHETIENRLNLKKYEIEVNLASTAGENNFVGVVYRVSLKEDEHGNGNKQIQKLILKVAPQNIARREKWFARLGFLREIYMYDKVLPYLRQFEQSKGISGGNCFNEYPKCYRTTDTELSESLLFEDLSVRGFSIIDRYTNDITPEHVRLLMRTLGKFHAISFALKDQHPEKFEELTSQLSPIFLRRDRPRIGERMTSQLELGLTLVSGEKDVHLFEKVKNLLDMNILDVAVDCVDPKLVGPSAVITHGDTWQNNFMYRYDNEGKPIEICLLDWQISQYTSPVIDILYFIFCCTTKELRDAHYDEFLEVYHEALSAHIKRLGSDPEKLFPYELMLEHFHKFGRFGLLIASVLLPVMTVESGNGIDLDSQQANDNQKSTLSSFISDKSRSRFEKRFRDIIGDMVRLEYI